MLGVRGRAGVPCCPQSASLSRFERANNAFALEHRRRRRRRRPPAASPSSSPSSSSSSQYLDALQSLLREAREEGTLVSSSAPVAVESDEKEDHGDSTSSSSWSISDSASFLSAALSSSTLGNKDDDSFVSEEEARDLLLKTGGWRRSRGGGRYQATTTSTTTSSTRETTEAASSPSAVAVPSPSSLAATLTALQEHAGLEMTSDEPSLARAIRRCPSLLALPAAQVALSAAFLRSLGLDASDVSVACSREPRLLGFGVGGGGNEGMAAVATFLRSRRVGMRSDDVARLAVSAPTVLGLSVSRSLEPRVAFLEKALGGGGGTNTAASSSSSVPPVARVLRAAPALLHANVEKMEETLRELEARLPSSDGDEGGAKARAIAAAPSLLLVGAEAVAETLEALEEVATADFGLEVDDEEEEEQEGEKKKRKKKTRETTSSKESVIPDLVRRHPSLLRHAFTGPQAVMLPAAEWLARLLSCCCAVVVSPSTSPASSPPLTSSLPSSASASSLLLRELLPESPTREGKALAAAAIRRAPALLGCSLAKLERTASWLLERASAASTAAAAAATAVAATAATTNDDDDNSATTTTTDSNPLSAVAKAAKSYPQLFGLSLANLDSKLSFLVEEVGMSDAEASAVLSSRMPQLLGLRLESLRARAAFLLDGYEENVEEGAEEENEKGGEKPSLSPTSSSSSPVALRGRRSPSEIAKFAPCLAMSLKRLVERHAAAEAAAAAVAVETATGEREEKKPLRRRRKGQRRPGLSSLLAPTDSALEGKLGLSSGWLSSAAEGDPKVREAIERAERVAREKEGLV